MKEATLAREESLLRSLWEGWKQVGKSVAHRRIETQKSERSLLTHLLSD